jgi:hypothetical protein
MQTQQTQQTQKFDFEKRNNSTDKKIERVNSGVLTIRKTIQLSDTKKQTTTYIYDDVTASKELNESENLKRIQSLKGVSGFLMRQSFQNHLKKNLKTILD